MGWSDLTRQSRNKLLAHQVANPHRTVQRNGMVLSSLTSSFTLVQSTLVSSAEQKIKSAQGAEVSQETTSSDSDSLKESNATSCLRSIRYLDPWKVLTGLTFQKDGIGKLV